MKLIDLLVRELPKHGGWPKGAHFIACDSDGAIDSYRNEPEKDDTGLNWRDSEGLGYFTHLFSSRAIDWECATITREQYEAALSASKQDDWLPGDLPPEGIECEVKSGKDSWTLCKVVHSSSAGVAFIYLEEPNGCVRYMGVLDSISAKAAANQFRPIFTEAERKREETKNAIAELCRSSASNGHSADLIYDAIAAGKIPGVKLEDCP